MFERPSVARVSRTTVTVARGATAGGAVPPTPPALPLAEQAAIDDMRRDRAYVGFIKDGAGRFTSWTCGVCGGPLVPTSPEHGSCPLCSERDSRDVCAQEDVA